MRASITSLIVPSRRPQRRTVVLGIVLLIFAVGMGYGAMVGHRNWNARLAHTERAALLSDAPTRPAWPHDAADAVTRSAR